MTQAFFKYALFITQYPENKVHSDVKDNCELATTIILIVLMSMAQNHKTIY